MTAAAVTAVALAAAPLASASACAKPHPRFVVSKLSIVGHHRTYDVASVDAVVRARVQVKDHDRKFDPTSVTLTVVEKIAGTPAAWTTVSARQAGHSRVVSNWHATITVAKGSVAPGTTATYCITLVTVSDGSLVTPVAKSAKGLVGRDCFKVTNSATA